jgi:hypothetical protein
MDLTLLFAVAVIAYLVWAIFVLPRVAPRWIGDQQPRLAHFPNVTDITPPWVTTHARPSPAVPAGQSMRHERSAADGVGARLALLLEKCMKDRGMRPPFMLCVVNSDGLWCIRVTSDGGNEAELLFAHPKKAILKLPATVFVIDEAGRAMSARVAADGPEAVTLMQ